MKTQTEKKPKKPQQRKRGLPEAKRARRVQSRKSRALNARLGS